ncbi:MAG: hypothetical protein WC728_16250 [Elusimicrobiota bacterium]
MGSYSFAFLHPELISGVVVNTGMMHEYEKTRRDLFPRGKFAVLLASPTDFRYEEMRGDREFLRSLGWRTERIEFEGGIGSLRRPPTAKRRAG